MLQRRRHKKHRAGLRAIEDRIELRNNEAAELRYGYVHWATTTFPLTAMASTQWRPPRRRHGGRRDTGAGTRAGTKRGGGTCAAANIRP